MLNEFIPSNNIDTIKRIRTQKIFITRGKDMRRRVT